MRRITLTRRTPLSVGPICMMGVGQTPQQAALAAVAGALREGHCIQSRATMAELATGATIDLETGAYLVMLPVKGE